MISDAVYAFAERMQFKLDKNKDKECDVMNPHGMGRKWGHCSDAYLLDRILDEFHELRQAIVSGNVEEIMNEAADVGNFAMMIHDNYRKESDSE